MGGWTVGLDRLDPKTLKKWLIIAAIVYFVFPFDLIPDFSGLPGRFDDALLIVFWIWFYRSHLHQYLANGRVSDASDNIADYGSGRGFSGSMPMLDPHEVLGIPRTASADEIRTAYRPWMQEYHPDKVSHLGEDLQRLAHEKSQEIQDAYRRLTRC